MRSAGEMAFLKTAQLGSIRAAARALDQDPSGISRRITQLERRLGTQLVDRSGNQTTVTAAGRIYYERLKVILDQLEALEAEIGGEESHPTGLLRVTAAIDFGQEFLAKWLLEFRDQHPGIDFDLILSSAFLDLAQHNVDVAIRIGNLPDSSLIARKIGEVPRVLVASRGYLDRNGVPQTAKDLEAHEFVFFAPGNRTQPLELTQPDGSIARVVRKGGVTINAVRSAVEAVRAGHGIHLGPLWAFSDAIETGAVQIVLPDHSHKALPLYVVRQPSVVVPARVSRFVEFLADRVRSVNGITV